MIPRLLLVDAVAMILLLRYATLPCCRYGYAFDTLPLFTLLDARFSLLCRCRLFYGFSMVFAGIRYVMLMPPALYADAGHDACCRDYFIVAARALACYVVYAYHCFLRHVSLRLFMMISPYAARIYAATPLAADCCRCRCLSAARLRAAFALMAICCCRLLFCRCCCHATTLDYAALMPLLRYARCLFDDTPRLVLCRYATKARYVIILMLPPATLMLDGYAISVIFMLR